MSKRIRRDSSPVALAASTGREWLSALEEHLTYDALEFPNGVADPPDSMSRRGFMKLLGASMALAGVAGCVREPDDKILTYVKSPPELVPGIPLHYATSMTLDGYATGLVVESRTGRPTKVEGNPEHPASLGTAGVYEQASVLQLYDPHRARGVRVGGRSASWSTIAAAFAPAQLRQRIGANGAGLSLLLEPTSSPFLAALIERVRSTYPAARIYFHAPLASSAQLTATRSVLGAPLLAQHDFQQSSVVVSLDADFVGSGPFHLRYASDFAQGRRAARAAGAAHRLYVAEQSPSPTGTVADNRVAVTSGSVGLIAAALWDTVTSTVQGGTPSPGSAIGALALPSLTPAERAWVQAAAADLVASAGRCIVVAGPHQSANVHSIACALNARLNASLRDLAEVTWYTPSPIIEAGEPSHDLARFAADLQSGSVDTLVILEGNPVYSAPADLDLLRLIRAVRNTLYLGAYDDETARAATWHVAAAHYLESWGDSRSYDGTTSLVQPLIAPLHGGRTPAELLSLLAGDAGTSAHNLLRESWRARDQSPSFDSWWDDSLRRGVVAGSATARQTPPVNGDAVAAARNALAASAASVDRHSLSITFTPSPAVHDGRFADNAWLQELPDPTTKLTWDNAALMSPALAAHIGVASGEIVTIHNRSHALDVPALIVPGHADGAMSLSIGYGRSGAEAIARDVGANANKLRVSSASYIDSGIVVTRTGRQHPLAITQTHWTLEGRGATILGLPQSSSATPKTTPARKRRPLTLYEPPKPPPDGFAADQWAMTIDLDTCTGCSACVVACQAENNIPVVGKDGVLASREMHWMRIDRYLTGPVDTPQMSVQPMLCQHCEKAPCEYVCPVEATVHSDDGLNEMVYNRCVGTRFCSNNCPYKVRRFNWFDYNAEISATEQMVKNPEVTVRARGVMEKCTFCVQRIRHAQMDAELAGEPRTGPVLTACQQTCPSRAITFGSLTDPSSEVVRSRKDQRSFAALEELGTEPRVRYLARVRNYNPDLAE